MTRDELDAIERARRALLACKTFIEHGGRLEDYVRWIAHGVDRAIAELEGIERRGRKGGSHDR